MVEQAIDHLRKNGHELYKYDHLPVFNHKITLSAERWPFPCV